MMTKISDDTVPAGIICAYSYVRMSTHKQLRGDSLRRQLARSRAFAAEHGLILDESLRDIGVSAWKGKNLKGGALGVFLKMVDDGRVARGSYLLIESLDRLSREAVPDALMLFMEIINAGITIVTLGEDRQVYSHASLKGDWTKLIVGLAVMSRGHEESQTKSERISAANKRKRDEARSGNSQITGRTPAWIDAERIDRDRYTFSLNDHAATVKTIFEMAARGLGSTAIARILNADNIPAFKSKDGWYQSIIKSLLRRTDVIGTFQPHRIVDGKRVPDGDPIEDYFPAAIDKDLFLQVQAMRPLTAHAGRRGKTFANLFTGLCSCSHCGGPMSLKMSRLKDGLTGYLVCSNHARGHRCEDGKKNFRYDILERAVLDHVEVLNLADILQVRQAGTIGKETDKRIASLTLLSEDLQRRERRLALALENEAEPIDTILALIKSRRAERTEVEAELQALKVERAAMERRAFSTPDADHIGELRKAWENAATDEERYQVRAEAHAAIREFVTCVDFDSVDNTATLIIANGIIAYTFKDGELIGHFDASAIIGAQGCEAA